MEPNIKHFERYRVDGNHWVRWHPKKVKTMPAVGRSKKLTCIGTYAVAMLALGTPASSGDWSGFFLGASVARHDARTDTASGHDSSAPGLHLGYDLDFGQLVLGGEVEVENAQVQIGSVETQEMRRVKLRAGYDFGRTLGYITLGGVRAESEQEHDTGTVVGLGLSYSLNQNFELGGELLYQDIDALEPGGLRRSNTVSLRASFRF